MNNRSSIPILVAILALLVPPTEADVSLEKPTPTRTVSADRRQVRWNNLFAESVRHNHIRRLIFEDELTVTTRGHTGDSYSRVDYTLLSVVGPVVCFSEVFDSEGFSRPGGSIKYSSVNLDSQSLEPAPITLLFRAEDVIAALKRDEVIAELTDSAEKKSLVAFLFSIPSSRCQDFRSMATHFVVSEIRDSSAVVVFGPEETCRGPFKTIEVELPIPSWSSSWFENASEQNSYASALGGDT